MKKNERNAGRKQKYKNGVETSVIHITIPTEVKKECISAIDGVVGKYKYWNKINTLLVFSCVWCYKFLRYFNLVREADTSSPRISDDRR